MNMQLAKLAQKANERVHRVKVCVVAAFLHAVISVSRIDLFRTLLEGADYCLLDEELCLIDLLDQK